MDGSLKVTAFEEWTNRQCEACAKIGIDTTAPAKFKQWFIDQGFEDVKELRYRWAIGTWPKDPKAKTLGKLTQINMLTGVEGFTLRLWTGVMGIPLEEVHKAIANVKKDLQNPKIHTYLPV